MPEVDLSNLSDEEIMNMLPPETEAAPQSDPQEEVQPNAETPADEPVVDDPADNGNQPEEEEQDEPNPLGAGDEEESDKPKGQPKPEEPKDPAGKPEAAKDDKAKQEEPKVTEAPINYEEAYKKIMAPFRANGKEISLQSPEEAVQLMQQGANYTKKMQALQPHLKVVKTLEMNGLLDQDKLSYLIDLDKKNPDAIRKLIKDSGIDPMDLDITSENDYKPGNHQISDAQYTFNTTLEDVASTPEGKELVTQIHREWDQSSKDAIWKEPQIMTALKAQKESGVYAKITTEMDRRKMLGQLQNVPFLQAYFNVGQELQQQGHLAAPQQAVTQPAPVAQPIPRTPVATRVAPNKAEEKNGDQVRAALPPKTTPRTAQPDFNPLSLSDEDFEKNASLAMRV